MVKAMKGETGKKVEKVVVAKQAQGGQRGKKGAKGVASKAGQKGESGKQGAKGVAGKSGKGIPSESEDTSLPYCPPLRYGDDLRVPLTPPINEEERKASAWP